MPVRLASLEQDGWTLLSGEARNALNPTSFHLPSRQVRESLVRGDAAKLMFDIKVRALGDLVASGVDRMWVIVERVEAGRYVGRLLNDPGWTEGLDLKPGTVVAFLPEHIIEVERSAEDRLNNPGD
jgi:polynucleotide 5'-kinase involved in rRNA processing